MGSSACVALTSYKLIVQSVTNTKVTTQSILPSRSVVTGNLPVRVFAGTIALGGARLVSVPTGAHSVPTFGGGAWLTVAGECSSWFRDFPFHLSGGLLSFFHIH